VAAKAVFRVAKYTLCPAVGAQTLPRGRDPVPNGLSEFSLRAGQA
jgi:hypothetical protein